jgi:hypothetical protein
MKFCAHGPEAGMNGIQEDSHSGEAQKYADKKPPSLIRFCRKPAAPWFAETTALTVIDSGHVVAAEK